MGTVGVNSFPTEHRHRLYVIFVGAKPLHLPFPCPLCATKWLLFVISPMTSGVRAAGNMLVVHFQSKKLSVEVK